MTVTPSAATAADAIVGALVSHVNVPVAAEASVFPIASIVSTVVEYVWPSVSAAAASA